MNAEIPYFDTVVPVACWEMDPPLVVCQRKVNHTIRKNLQLDLCQSDDGKTTRFKWIEVTGRLVTTNGTRRLRLNGVPVIHGRSEILEQERRNAA